MIDIRPLEFEHLELLTEPVTEPGLVAMIEDKKAYWQNLINTGTAFSAFSDGEFLGCAGYAMPWPGVAEVWLWAMPEVKKIPVSLTKLLLRALKHIEKERRVHRISAEVRVGNTRAQRWVSIMGFVYEGTMKKRGPDGSDFMLYARVRAQCST
jgi:RimJ/RimL family protein N-acetyltransferase